MGVIEGRTNLSTGGRWRSSVSDNRRLSAHKHTHPCNCNPVLCSLGHTGPLLLEGHDEAGGEGPQWWIVIAIQ